MSYAPIDDDVRSFIQRQLASGFEDPSELSERAAEVYEGDPEDYEELVQRASEARERELATWPEVTDCDRLDRAFGRLERSAVLARHHFACCSNCGHFEIRDEVHDARERGQRVDGYVFYHWQDTDRAIGGRSLDLRYRATDDGDEATRAVGHRIADALRAEGLVTAWDGDPTRTIQLAPFDWKRRGPPAPPEKAAPTADECVATWCAALPPAQAADTALL
jgi:hypothetical protein